MMLFLKVITNLVAVSAFLTVGTASALSVTADTSFGPSPGTIGAFRSVPEGGTVGSRIVEQDGIVEGFIIGNDVGAFSGYSVSRTEISNFNGGVDNHLITSSYSWEDTFTNTSSVGQNYNYLLNIDSGFLGLITDGVGPSNASTSEFARYQIDVLLNGSSIWSSRTEVSQSLGGTTQNQSGTSFGGSFGNFTIPAGGLLDFASLVPSVVGGSAYGYQWGAFNDTVNLGVIAAGASFTLTYLAVIEAGGFNSTQEFNGYTSVASLGDPATLSSSPANQVSVVPVPASIFLMGSGLIGLLVPMRCKRTSNVAL